MNIRKHNIEGEDEFQPIRYRNQEFKVQDFVMMKFWKELAKNDIDVQMDSTQILDFINMLYGYKYRSMYFVKRYYNEHSTHKNLSSESVMNYIKHELLRYNTDNIDEDMVINAVYQSTDVETFFVIFDMEKSLSILFDDLNNVLQATLDEYEISGESNFLSFMNLKKGIMGQSPPKTRLINSVASRELQKSAPIFNIGSSPKRMSSNNFK